MEFLAVTPGVHSIEILTLTDVESGFSMNLRYVLGYFPNIYWFSMTNLPQVCHGYCCPRTQQLVQPPKLQGRDSGQPKLRQEH